MLYRVHLAMNEVRTRTLVVIDTDCIASCKSNYHTITAVTAGGREQICFDVVAYVLYKRNYELQYLKHPSSSLASPNFA